MDHDEITADDTTPKLVIVKSASLYTESQRGGPIHKVTNEGETTVRFEFFKTTTASDQAWFLQKIEEAVVDIIHDHSRMETWVR